MPTKKRRAAAADPSLVAGKTPDELRDLYKATHKEYEDTRIEIARLKVLHGIDVLDKKRKTLDQSLVLIQDTIGISGTELRKELCLGKTNKQLAARVARKRIKQTVPPDEQGEMLDDEDEDVIDEVGYELEFDEEEDLYEVSDDEGVLFVEDDE